MAGAALELDQAAVTVLAIVIGILLAACFAVNGPALDIQAAILVVQMLRPLDKGSTGILRAVDQPPQRVVLKDIGGENCTSAILQDRGVLLPILDFSRNAENYPCPLSLYLSKQRAAPCLSKCA